MNRPTLIQGIGVAVLATGVAFAAGPLLGALFGGAFGAKAAVVLGAGAYLAYLLSKGRGRAGRVFLGALCFGLLGFCLLGATTVAATAAVAALLIWLVRALTFYSSVAAAGADALVVGLAVVAGIGAVSSSGSVVAGIWCFFLVQALHAVIPTRLGERDPKRGRDGAADRFSRAHGAAEAAIEALIRRSN